MKSLLIFSFFIAGFSAYSAEKEEIQKLQCEALKELANNDIKPIDSKIGDQLKTLVIKNSCEFSQEGEIQFDTVTCVQICTKDKNHACTEGCLKVDQHYQDLAKNISKAFLEGKRANSKDEKSELEELKGKEPASTETAIKPELKPEQQDPILKEIEKM